MQLIDSVKIPPKSLMDKILVVEAKDAKN